MSTPPIIYQSKFLKDPDQAFKSLQADLSWQRRDNTPRSEYYVNEIPVPYTYGVGRGEREYLSQPSHEIIESIKAKLKEITGFNFEVCFLNRYHNQFDHLGWHADDSPEMDDDRPIAIVSLGIEREIWFCPKEDKTDLFKQKLEHGSLCLMQPGMQDTHLHRIPKAGFDCGEQLASLLEDIENLN